MDLSHGETGVPEHSRHSANACRVRLDPGEGNGTPLQSSCLENSMDAGAWQDTVHAVAESDMTERLHFLSFYSSFWRRKLQPTPVFLPEESHGQGSLVDYSLQGRKESDTTKQLTRTHKVGSCDSEG